MSLAPQLSQLNRLNQLCYFNTLSLKPLDVEIMKRLGSRVNLIPVIAKADTMTPNDLQAFKKRVRDAISHHGIRIYTPPVETDDAQAAEHAKSLIVSIPSTLASVSLIWLTPCPFQSAMPFSIIGSTQDVVTADGRSVKGREYLWGVAEGE